MELPIAGTDRSELSLVPVADDENAWARRDISLWFVGEHFQCPECGLTLDAEHLETCWPSPEVPSARWIVRR
jgi:hypothetical protein